MDHSILALELCLRLEPGSPLRSELKELVATHPATSSPGRKWELMKRVSDLLLAHEHLFELGCWDFFDTDAKALSDYDMWSNGMITEEGARKEASWDPFAQSEARFMTFTVALLLVQGTRCERELAKVCETSEEKLWRVKTFAKVVRALARVNFAAVKSDVLYLIPGDETWGLTAQDLLDPKFHYLRKIERPAA